MTAHVIADSVNPDGKRITTLQLRYWRAIHSEFMTHRSFCISGDSRLDFDLPRSGSNCASRRVHSMSIREFVEKWHKGSRTGKAPRFKEGLLLSLQDEVSYSANEVAALMGVSSACNLNTHCRDGSVIARKVGRQWFATGKAWKDWRSSAGTRRFSLRPRLSKMRIRQVNEDTGEVITSTVRDCVFSGVKKVFRLTAGEFSIEATEDHLVLTGEGWKRLADIRVGVDTVVTYKYGVLAGEDPYRKIGGKWVSQWSRKVRFQVSERQGGRCAETGSPLEASFHIHHVIPRHERPDLAFSLENVVAVNADAHRRLHGAQGWQTGVPLGSQLQRVSEIVASGEVDTYDLEISGKFANFFADGVVVHNSRNASSSRAIPVRKVLAQVWNDPAGPEHWGANQAGMQARGELVGWRLTASQMLWRTAGRATCGAAWAAMKLGLHKQVANRLLEPWQFISVVVTATEWKNFIALRDHPDAQPEIRTLAQEIRTAMAISVPAKLQWGEWHLPYGPRGQPEGVAEVRRSLRSSVARCARVSYLTHEGRETSAADDANLHDRLLEANPPHMSPAEHQAQAQQGWHANFNGWRSYRRLLGK